MLNESIPEDEENDSRSAYTRVKTVQEIVESHSVSELVKGSEFISFFEDLELTTLKDSMKQFDKKMKMAKQKEEFTLLIKQRCTQPKTEVNVVYFKLKPIQKKILIFIVHLNFNDFYDSRPVLFQNRAFLIS
jgi:16S rRNA C1402 (ribose-2'-O) methylase RsmI